MFRDDFEIATLVRFTPTSNFRVAGLLIYQSQGSAMQFGCAFAQCPIAHVCAGNASISIKSRRAQLAVRAPPYL
jgi:hypothetical protein